MIPWKLIVNFPSDQALSHLQTIPEPHPQAESLIQLQETRYITGAEAGALLTFPA